MAAPPNIKLRSIRQPIPRGYVLGRTSNGNGPPELIPVSNFAHTLAATGATPPGGSGITQLTGDVTAGPGSGSQAATIANNAVTTAKVLDANVTNAKLASNAVTTVKITDANVTNAKLANMAGHSYKGNNTASSAAPLDLTATQLTAELNAMVGDTGTGGTKGLVPAPASGDAAAGKFLKANGTFAVPPDTGITQLTGDVTAGSGSGSQAATLSSTGVTAASYNFTTLTVDAKGRLTAASSNPYVTNDTGQVTINFSGATLPAGPAGTNLQVAGPDTAQTRLVFDGFAHQPNMIFRRSNGTVSSPSALLSTDIIGQFSGFGYGATGYSTASRTGIRFLAGETWTDAAQGAYFDMFTTTNGTLTSKFVATLRPTGCTFLGTTTNDDAAAAFMGEYISATVLVGSAVALTSTATANVTSISLTAGDWDVWGNVAFAPAGTTTTSKQTAAISTTSATLPTSPNGGAYAEDNSVPATGKGSTMPVGTMRISLASTTTVYLVAQATFAASTNSVYGFIGARRAR